MQKTNRLTILEDSLVKKEAEFQRRLDAHFADVKRGNGQPMNDKRNGQATLNRWDKLETWKDGFTDYHDAIALYNDAFVIDAVGLFKRH